MPSRGDGSLHLVPKPSPHRAGGWGETVDGTVVVSSKIQSATVITWRELGARRDEKHPDYRMVVEPEASQFDKGLPT